ncbi:hypothetical protein D770_07165 [Flammeovirgaceae bacterium 311]|nr:hypothetical protein D770_07165 [Flammeovirgaceae bacterium 311]
MKKVFFLFLLLGSCLQSVQAQSRSEGLSILWGNPQQESKRSTLADVIGHDESGFYALRLKVGAFYGINSKFSLEHYDNSMNKTRTVEVDLETDNKKRSLEQIVHYNNRLFIFTSLADQKSKQKKLFLQPISKTSLQPVGEPQQISSIDYTGYSKGNSGNFGFSVSSDSTKFLVFYNLPYDQGENERFGFHVLDWEMKQLWEKQIELPYQEELFEVDRYKVDNAGNIHLLGRLFNEKRKLKRKGEPNYKYQVLSYRDNGSSLTDYAVEIPGKFLNDMQIAILPNQDIICAGFFSPARTNSISGSYFLTIDAKTKQVKKQSFKDFDADFLTENMREGKAAATKEKIEKGKSVELYEFDLDDLVLREDGGAMLVGEQYFIRVMTTYSPNGGISSTKTQYHYNNIIVVNINPQGEIEWAHQIPKRQRTVNDGGFYSSYTMAVVQDKLYFIFNDHPKNLIAKQGQVYNMRLTGNDAIVVMVEMDSQGNQTRRPLFKASDASVIIRPKVCEQLTNQEVVIFGQRRRLQRFAKISLQSDSQSSSLK